MKIINVFHESPNEVSIYVSSKERPTRIWAIANSPWPHREIDIIQIQPRSLKRDIFAFWPLHVVINIMFVGLPLLGYAGVWAYERCVSLWDVRIRYRLVLNLRTVAGAAGYDYCISTKTLT